MVCTGPVSLRRPGAAADRHRQPARRAGRPRRRGRDRGVPAVHQPQRLRPQRVLRRPSRSTSPPWPRRCARSTWRSSTPGFLLQVDDPWLIEILTEDPQRPGRAPPPRPRSTSRRSTTRCAASRPRGSGCTPATGSTTGRACTTSRWPRSRRSCCGSTRAPTPSRSPTRATSTSGGSGRDLKLPDGKILIPGCSGTPPTTSSTPS